MTNDINDLLRKIRMRTQYTTYSSNAELKSMLDDIRKMIHGWGQNNGD